MNNFSHHLANDNIKNNSSHIDVNNNAQTNNQPLIRKKLIRYSYIREAFDEQVGVYWEKRGK